MFPIGNVARARALFERRQLMLAARVEGQRLDPMHRSRGERRIKIKDEFLREVAEAA